MQLYIKNMVCDRCIMVVRQELEKSGLEPVKVELGKAEVLTDFGEGEKERFIERLRVLGFELLEDKRHVVAERIKNRIIELVHRKDNELKINLSDHLSTELQQDYNTLSRLFSEVEACSIEQFYIAQKTERVKELLSYNELSINEIASSLNYSSAAHLSNQFRKVTGISPREFRNRMERRSLDEV